MSHRNATCNHTHQTFYPCLKAGNRTSRYTHIQETVTMELAFLNKSMSMMPYYDAVPDINLIQTNTTLAITT